MDQLRGLLEGSRGASGEAVQSFFALHKVLSAVCLSCALLCARHVLCCVPVMCLAVCPSCALLCARHVLCCVPVCDSIFTLGRRSRPVLWL